MFSRHAGSELLKRIGISLLLFTVGVILIPQLGTGLPFAAIGMIVAFVMLFGAIISLLNLHAVKNVVGVLAVVCAALLLLPRPGLRGVPIDVLT